MEPIFSIIFRTLPPISTDDSDFFPRKQHRNEDITLDFHPDVRQPSVDPNWDRVGAAYDSLHTLLCSDALLLDGFLDKAFVRKLLSNLLDSFDLREAESVGKILPLIWYRSYDLKNAIWVSAMETLLQFLAESRAHIGNGISEILFFFASKIEEIPRDGRFYLIQILARLHKPICFAHYNQPLRLCFSNILQQDSDFADYVIWGILNYWPTKLPSKEALMLQEIQDLVIDIPWTRLFWCIGPLFRRLDSCLRSKHYLVVTRALDVFDTPALWRVAETVNSLIQIIGGGLHVAAEHWNIDVKKLAIEVEGIYREIEGNGGRKRKRVGIESDDEKSKLVKLEDQSATSCFTEYFW